MVVCLVFAPPGSKNISLTVNGVADIKKAKQKFAASHSSLQGRTNEVLLIFEGKRGVKTVRSDVKTVLSDMKTVWSDTKTVWSGVEWCSMEPILEE